MLILISPCSVSETPTEQTSLQLHVLLSEDSTAPVVRYRCVPSTFIPTVLLPRASTTWTYHDCLGGDWKEVEDEVNGSVRGSGPGPYGGDPSSLWSRASKKERKDLVITEVKRMEQEEDGVETGAQGHWAVWGRASCVKVSLDGATAKCSGSWRRWWKKEG